MWKYLVILSVIGALAVYVAIQDQRSATKSTEQSTAPSKAVVAPEAHNDHPKSDTENTKRNSPRWYRLFAWPEGITTWAIILTLLAVAEQARESAKATRAVRDSLPHQQQAAEAALLNAQAVIHAERPWMVIEHKGYHSQGRGTYVFKIEAVNYGKSPAMIDICTDPIIKACIFPDKELPLPYPAPGSLLLNPKILTPGKRMDITIFDPDSIDNETKRAIFRTENQGSEASKIVIFGELVYGDGISKRTLSNSVLLYQGQVGLFRGRPKPYHVRSSRIQHLDIAGKRPISKLGHYQVS
jgi:hypothetical protein